MPSADIGNVIYQNAMKYLLIAILTFGFHPVALAADDCKPPVNCKKGEFCPPDCGGPESLTGGTRHHV
jgi:hypothetical protein